MLEFGCCIARHTEDNGATCGKSVSSLTVNRALGRHMSSQESLDLEWNIVGKSITDTELQRLRALREAVQDLDGHPACCKRPLSQQAQTLLRFLRGREGNIVAAEKMFRDSLDWRNSIDLDEKLAEWREELNAGVTARSQMVRRYGTDAMVVDDKYGVPVWLMRMSVSDPAGILREMGKEALLIHTLSNMEYMHSMLREAMFRQNMVVRGCVQIIDVGDYGAYGVPNWYSRMWDGFRVGKDAFKIFHLNYPETARKVFLIRMGSVTHMIHQACQPFIPERTKKKMRGFSYYAATWEKELKEEVPNISAFPAFITSDSEESKRLATPKGGLVPSKSEWLESHGHRNGLRGDGAQPKISRVHSLACCKRRQGGSPSRARAKSL